MTADLNNRPELPDVIPQGEVTVEDEEHTYEEFETDSGSEKTYTYVLEKAPINEIERVTGVDRTDSARTFNNGVDYELAAKVSDRSEVFTYSSMETEYELIDGPDSGSVSIVDGSGDTYTEGTDFTVINPDGAATDTIVWEDDGSTPDEQETFTATYQTTAQNSVIEWQTDANNLPKPGTKFYVTYRAPSIVSRYLDSSEEKLDSVEDNIRGVIEGKFIESASGQELDEIGKLFGEVIGKRRGRDDGQYRIYLKSVVQSFISRGTTNGIKLAVSAASGVPITDITINEDFDDTSYEIEVIPENPVNTPLISEVAEISDPSGVNLDGFRIKPFSANPDEMEADDDTTITEGNLIEEDVGSKDESEAIFSDRLTEENVGSDDSVTTAVTNVGWGSMNWDDGNWTL